MKTETVTIVFSANDNYAMLAGIALCSVFENKKGDYPIQVFILDGGISARNKERLRVLEKRYGFSINYIFPDRKLFEGVLAANANAEAEWPIEAYYRIAVASILPDSCRRAIYLDCDVMVRGDIKELFDADLGGKTLGGVVNGEVDSLRKHFKELCESVSLALPEGAEYFNSGVLLIDLDRWRERDTEKKLFQFMRKNYDKVWYPDNDALNTVLFEDWKRLPTKYNLLAEFAFQREDDEPLVIHFAGGGKPWYLFSALPYQPEYVRYANKTPWRNEKYRKLMDVPFAKKYHFYPFVWTIWVAYKKIKKTLIK